MPADHLYVAALTNSDSLSIDPNTAAAKIAAEAIGRPCHDPAPITLPTEVLDSYVEIYQIDPENTRTISRDGTHMFMQRTGGRKLEIFPSRSGEFFLRTPSSGFRSPRMGKERLSESFRAGSTERQTSEKRLC